MLSKRSPNEKLLGGNRSIAGAAESGSCEKRSENFNSVMSISVLEMADGRDRAGFSVVVQNHCWNAILARMLWRQGRRAGSARLSARHSSLAGLPRVNCSWWLQTEQGQVGDSGERGDSSGDDQARGGLVLGGAQLAPARESCKPCLTRAACGAFTWIAKARRGCHLPLLQSSRRLSSVLPTPICAFLGAPSASGHTRQQKDKPSLNLRSQHLPI